MIVEEFVNGLKHTYSDDKHKLLQVDTGIVYGSEVWDIASTTHTYQETEEIEKEENTEDETADIDSTIQGN